MRVSACPLREEHVGRRANEGRGWGREGWPRRPGDATVEGERRRSLARRFWRPPIGRRAVPSTERSKDVPTEGWSFPADDRWCRARRRTKKRPRAGVLPSPRARPSDRAIGSILAGTRARHRMRDVRERRFRIARVPGACRSRPVRPALDGTARPERKSACAITFGVGKPPRREPRGSNAHVPRLDRSSAITRTSALGVRCG